MTEIVHKGKVSYRNDDNRNDFKNDVKRFKQFGTRLFVFFCLMHQKNYDFLSIICPLPVVNLHIFG